MDVARPFQVPRIWRAEMRIAWPDGAVADLTSGKRILGVLSAPDVFEVILGPLG
jgi:hypothetical protein